MTNLKLIKAVTQKADAAQERKQNQCRFQEAIADKVQDDRKSVKQGFHDWRRVELYITIFSTIGLFIAVADYEAALYVGRTGIGKLNLDTDKP